MKKFNSFKEYLDSKGKLVKSSEDDNPDYKGSAPSAPAQEPSKGEKSKALPYAASGISNKSAKDGLGNVKTPGSDEYKVDEMSDWEYISHMLKETQYGDDMPTVSCPRCGCNHTPSPTESTVYMSHLMSANPKTIKNLIREMKRSNGFGSLVTEMFNHPEMYSEISDKLDNDDCGPAHAKKFAKAMNENYMKYMRQSGMLDEAAGSALAKPRGFDPDDDLGDEDSAPMPPEADSLVPKGDDMDIPRDDIDMDDSDGNDMDIPRDDMKPPEGMDTEEMPDDLPGQGGEPSDEEEPIVTPYKPGKELGSTRMVKEMARYDHMLDLMREMSA